LLFQLNMISSFNCFSPNSLHPLWIENTNYPCYIKHLACNLNMLWFILYMCASLMYGYQAWRLNASLCDPTRNHPFKLLKTIGPIFILKWIYIFLIPCFSIGQYYVIFFPLKFRIVVKLLLITTPQSFFLKFKCALELLFCKLCFFVSHIKQWIKNLVTNFFARKIIFALVCEFMQF